jgi:hypothetical protein
MLAGAAAGTSDSAEKLKRKPHAGWLWPRSWRETYLTWRRGSGYTSASVCCSEALSLAEKCIDIYSVDTPCHTCDSQTLWYKLLMIYFVDLFCLLFPSLRERNV